MNKVTMHRLWLVTFSSTLSVLCAFSLLAAGCKPVKNKPDYPELRILFHDASALFVQYRQDLQKCETPEQAIQIINRHHSTLEKMITRKSEIEKIYPELQSFTTKKAVADGLPEFKEFNRVFLEFYRDADILNRRFYQHKEYRKISQRELVILAKLQ